jgi:uncharacterized protein
MKLIQYIMLFISYVLLLGCDAQPTQALLAPATKIATEKRPALWKVTSKKSDSAAIYLFGAIHLLPDETKWQSINIDRAIEDSNSLTIELAGTDDISNVSAIFNRMAVTKGLPPVTQRIDQKLLPQLNAAISSGNTPEKTLNQLETWAAALRIASTTSANIGLGSSNAVETVLNYRFSAAGKPSRGLETIIQQFSFFDQLPEAEQRAMLNAILRGTKDQSAQTQRLINAWLIGDQSGILKQANTGIMASAKMREILLTKRNQRWADQLAAWIDRGEKTFVAVGAAHLAGKQGIPALLARRGYVVTRVQ